MARAGRPLILLLGMLGLQTAWAPPSAPASVKPSCTIEQITFTAGMQENGWPVISGDGNRIVFFSSAEPTTGDDLRGYDYFLYEVEGERFSRISETAVRSHMPKRPAIDQKGRRIAFLANGDPVRGGNRDGNYDIFLFDAGAGLSQLTDTTSARNGDPNLNGDGTRVVFSSDGPLVQGSNEDESAEIFVFDTALRGFQQVTETASRSRLPSISRDGRYVAFLSSADLDPGHNTDGNDEVFLADLQTGSFYQLTDTVDGWLSAPVLTADGHRVFFQSTGPLSSGRQPQGMARIQLIDLMRAELRDLGPGLGNYSLSADEGGTRIAYGLGEVRLLDVPAAASSLEVKSRRLVDAEPGTGCLTCQPSISDDGRRVAFVSSSDLVSGSNPDGNSEIFLATCESPAALECVPDDVTLCLREGRFRVTTHWGTQEGASGLGVARQLTESAGWFSLQPGDDVEIVVKVLDHCAQSDRFSVYVAGLTTVGAEVTVEDMQSGGTTTYSNPPGRLFAPRRDVTSFTACR